MKLFYITPLLLLFTINLFAQNDSTFQIISDDATIKGLNLLEFSEKSSVNLTSSFASQLTVGKVLVRHRVSDNSYCVFIASLDVKTSKEYTQFKYADTIGIDTLMKYRIYEYTLAKPDLEIKTIICSKYGFYVKSRSSVSILCGNNWVNFESDKPSTNAYQKAAVQTREGFRLKRKVINICGYTMLGLGVLVHVAAFTAGDEGSQIHPAAFICDALGGCLFGISYLYKMQEKALLGYDIQNLPHLNLSVIPKSNANSQPTLGIGIAYSLNF